MRVSTIRTSAPGCMYDNRNLKTLPASDIRNSKRQDRKPPYPRYSARRTALLGAEPRSAVYLFLNILNIEHISKTKDAHIYSDT